LGSLAALSLKDARDKAKELRRHALNGRDPVAERDREFVVIPDFRKASRETHEALSSGWAAKTAAAFLASLQEHAWPVIGAKLVDQIEASHLQDVLRPIWTTKPAMARKVRQFMATVLNFSKSRGWRATEAPGKAVTIGLPKRPKAGHFKAMPYADVPGYFAQARLEALTSSRGALLFQLLTAARPGEVRHARWCQIEFDKREWHRPAEIMKNDLPHVVALSPAAVALLRRIDRPTSGDGLIFPGQHGRVLSDMSLNKVLRTANQLYHAHGFRSSFRDWAAEKMPQIPDPVAEAALAHLVTDEVVRAYKRTKFAVMQRELLENWASFVVGDSQ
jgi:integrase